MGEPDPPERVPLRHSVPANDKNYCALNRTAKVLLFELICNQYRGKNNGFLCCVFGLMKDRNIGSKNTVNGQVGLLKIAKK